MRACARLQRVNSGGLRFDGRNSLNLSYRQLFHRGCIFGAEGRLEEGLIAGLTLTEHTALVADDNLRIDWKDMHKRTISRIDHYRVKGQAADNIEQLSGGNQQRVLMGLLPDDRNYSFWNSRRGASMWIRRAGSGRSCWLAVSKAQLSSSIHLIWRSWSPTATGSSYFMPAACTRCRMPTTPTLTSWVS